MSEFMGTPGPWIVDRTVIRGAADHLGRTVAVASTLNVAWPYGRRATKEEPYNACLIAAAPELLEALQYALETLKDCDMDLFHNVIEVGDAAIAKALGNTMTTDQLIARLEQLLRERAESKKEKEND